MRAPMDVETRLFEELVLDFAAKELVGNREENDRYPFGPLFEDVLRKARAVGFFSVTLPEELDGAARGMTDLAILLEGICRFDASLGGVIFTDTLAKELLYRSRGFVLLSDLLPRVEDYRGFLFAFPAYRHPAEIICLEAEEKDEGLYSLSGTAEYVVLGGLAAHAVLPARVAGSDGYSFFLVDLPGEGVESSPPVLSLGLHACPSVDLVLSGAEGALVGEEGEGGIYFERAADRMYAAAAAMALGVMKGSFDTALEYTRQRRQGGREIVNWSEVRRILAGMAVKAKAADMLVSEVCRAVDGNEPGWRLGARAAALHVQRAACEVTTDGIQLLGGNGYMEEYGQEKRFRDAEQIQSLLGSAALRDLDFIGKVVDGEELF